MIIKRFPTEYQMDSQDCGPACLKMVAKYYGRYFSLQYLRDKCGLTKDGVSMRSLSVGAENIALRTLAVEATITDIVEKVPLPAILFWNENHFVVVYNANKKHVFISDPSKGHVKYTHDEFRDGFYMKGRSHGVLLALEPTPEFTVTQEEREQEKESLLSILRYFTPYKRNFALVCIVMLIATLLQAILPFISKAVIDVGISTSDIKFINMVLVGNIAILTSIMIFNVIRDWVLMHITARVNIALISDYLIKLMNLPVSFFENKLLGDILQRAQDHERIRSFIMNNSLSLVFSSFTFIIFSIILLIYNVPIFLIFIFGSALYVG